MHGGGVNMKGCTTLFVSNLPETTHWRNLSQMFRNGGPSYKDILLNSNRDRIMESYKGVEVVDLNNEEIRRDLEKGNWEALSDWFVKVEPWTSNAPPPYRVTWLVIQGVPLHAWNEKSFSNIANLWGELISIDSGTLNMTNYISGFIQISTKQLSKIDETILLNCKNVKFSVRVFEATDDSRLFGSRKAISDSISTSSDQISLKDESSCSQPSGAGHAEPGSALELKEHCRVPTSFNVVTDNGTNCLEMVVKDTRVASDVLASEQVVDSGFEKVDKDISFQQVCQVGNCEAAAVKNLENVDFYYGGVNSRDFEQVFTRLLMLFPSKLIMAIMSTRYCWGCWETKSLLDVVLFSGLSQTIEGLGDMGQLESRVQHEKLVDEDNVSAGACCETLTSHKDQVNALNPIGNGSCEGVGMQLLVTVESDPKVASRVADHPSMLCGSCCWHGCEACFIDVL
ncbi:hypothetical protein V6N13_060614 [Hibiscus sabdariffa]